MFSLTSTTGTSISIEESPEVLDTRLSLGIGAVSRRPPRVQLDQLFPPPHTLVVPEDKGSSRRKKKKGESTTTRQHRHSKRARTMHGGNDDDDVGDGGDGGARKKLQLTGEQAALLEDSFRAHNILSQGEKHELARRLRLSARQVEVWFQNRRARTKLKQTEVDRELLRRWCDWLSDENARLRRELAEVRSSSAVLSRLTAAAATVCPSCHELAHVAGDQMAA